MASLAASSQTEDGGGGPQISSDLFQGPGKGMSYKVMDIWEDGGKYYKSPS